MVRAALVGARRDGLDFHDAWTYRAEPALLERVEESAAPLRREWLRVIADTLEEWQAAYEGRETHFSLALAGRDLLGAGIADYLVDPWSVAA